MNFFYNTLTIARYERKILFRSWFFRIFAILSIVVIGLFGGTTLFDSNTFTWMYRSVPSALIYSNIFLLNIFQSVIAVFLATDFLKRDKKLNTSEVLFIRPMTNLEYIAGKTLGLLTVFVVLNLLVMMLSVVFLLITKQVELRILPIIFYFLLVSIPSLFFVIGLSYALMTLIKNQPVTFIILLGYIALVLFYLGSKLAYVFDYMVFKMPLPYSDIIGFSNLDHSLLHRGAYLLLGLGLILFTTWRLNRLPDNPNSGWKLAAFAFVFIFASGFALFKIAATHKNLIAKREANTLLSAQYFNHLVPEMKRANIKIEYANELKANATLTLKNNHQQAIDTIVLSINPGLLVEKVVKNNVELPFKQNNFLLFVIPSEPLSENNQVEIEIHYSGIPDMNIAYLDNKHEDVFGMNQAMTLRVDRKYGFYSSNYVLLNKEVLWYPVPGVVYDPTRPAIFKQQFTKFDLTVVSKPGMLPVSQGIRTTADSIEYHFDIRDPLPQLSLNIGNFEEKRIEIGGIDVGIAYIKGHDYFADHFNELGDTLNSLIVEYLDDYERQLGMFYPYPVFTLVEAPMQFASLPHSWTSTLGNIQPQIINFPEWGFNVMQADFNSATRRIKRESERNKEGLTDKEIQSRVFANFLRSTFSTDQVNMRFGAPTAASGGNPYHIFPNYFYFVNYITSTECPVLNYAFESYLMKGRDNPGQMFMSRMTGIGESEQANLKLKEQSLKQIISEEPDQQVVNIVLKAKGSYLLTWMEKQTEGKDFNDFILGYLYDNSYREIKYEELIKDLSLSFNAEFGNILKDWYNASSLPAFGLGSINVIETIDRSQSVYLVRTKVSNFNNVDGMVKFSFMLGEGQRGGGGRGGFMGGGFMQSDPEERIYVIEANQTKEIQIVVNDAPRSVTFNTLLSENIPSSTMMFGMQSEKIDNISAIEYEKVIDSPVSLIDPGELVVDNRDNGFSIYDPALENPLRKWVESRKTKSETEFVGEGFGQAPSTWSLVANSDYFGKIEHSAMMVRSGDGSKTATWKIELPTAGYYDIYVNLTQQRRFGGPGRRNSDPEGSYVYKVFHDDGEEEVSLELKSFENGWNLLGSFYISSDTSTVVLTDKGGAERVVADAVKWVVQR